MTTVVIGAGLIGLCTAKALLDRGESVHLLEAREGVALETSFANGGMLTPSLPEPWNDPGVHRHMAASLFDPKSSMKLHLHAVPSLFLWGMKFLRNSAPSRFYRSCEDNFRLATYSLACTQAVTQRLKLEYSQGTGGTLSVFRTERDLNAKKQVSDRLAAIGMKYRLLDSNEIAALEPSLADVRKQLVAGIHFTDDEFGDARYFCQALASAVSEAGGRIDTGVRVTKLVHARGRITAVRTESGEIRTSRVVIAAGPFSRSLLRPLGVSLPIRPAKGYSVTIDAGHLSNTPRIPVLDDSMHAGVTPLDSRLRLVGTAEFTGFDTRIEQVRVDSLFDMLQALFPALDARIDRNKATPWAGLRPMSADGKPIVGATDVEGLYVNTGHGHLGWTMAMGSGELLADLMHGNKPPIDPSPFALPGR
ncbi:MAG: D-amino acid dehydrogenase [Woeseiaceae bacterium]